MHTTRPHMATHQSTRSLLLPPSPPLPPPSRKARPERTSRDACDVVDDDDDEEEDEEEEDIFNDLAYSVSTPRKSLLICSVSSTASVAKAFGRSQDDSLVCGLK